MVPKVKPSLFIGSSTENLTLANTLQDALDYETEPFVWHQDGFPPSKYPLEALEKHLDHVDFAVFLFAPDDTTVTRGENRNTVRDNVLFELGLFIGRLGRSRTFIVKPRGVQLDLASDLYGITPVEYAPSRNDDNLSASVGPATRKILDLVRSLGPRAKASEAGSLESSAEDIRPVQKASNALALDGNSVLSDYHVAYWMATLDKELNQQREIEEAFRKSKLNHSAQAIAEWEAWTAVVRMRSGETGGLQRVRDLAAEFPESPPLQCTLGDALEYYADSQGASAAYGNALDISEDIERAAIAIMRLVGIKKPLAFGDRQALRAHLLALPRAGREDERSLALAMRSLSTSAGLPQITQAIDQVRVGQAPEDSSLKFSLAYSFSPSDADLSMLYYESIPAEERGGTAWNNLGVAYSHLQMPGLSIAAYEDAAKKGESLADGNLVYKLIQGGFFELARARAEKAIARPHHHNSNVMALNALDQAQAEEENKRKSARSAAEAKQVLIQLLGQAALKPGDTDIRGNWLTPEGSIEITQNPDGSFVARGEYVREAPPNPFAVALFSPPKTFVNTVVTARLQRFGDAFEGEIEHVTGESSSSVLLGPSNRRQPIVLVPSDQATLKVCVAGFQREELEWKRNVTGLIVDATNELGLS